MLTNQEKAKVFSRIESTYKLLGFPCSVDESKMLVEILATSYSYDKILEAINHIVCTMKFRPKPSDFIEYLDNKPSQMESDLEVLKIKKAISDHGWCNPVPAREYCGELVWEVVERLGGWVEVCKWDYATMSYNLSHAAKIYRALNDKKHLKLDGEIKIRLEAQKGASEIDGFVLGEKISGDKNRA